MLEIIAYAGFFFSFAFMVGAFFQAFMYLTLITAQIVGRPQSEVSWDYKALGRNIMLWTGVTAFLWHYNFGG